MEIPRPIGAFVGREHELERIANLMDEETLFLIYGVAGIGKTELAYRAVRAVRERPEWREARRVLVHVRPGATLTRVLTELLAATGAVREPRRGQRTDDAYDASMLEALATALDAEPHVVLLDDLHNLPRESVPALLAYLGRHVAASRIFATSRRHVAMHGDAPTPVTTTLAPLDQACTARMLEVLATRLDVSCPDATQVFAATHGSPFYIRQTLARRRAGADALADSLTSLSAPARRLLLLAVVAQRPMSTAEANVHHAPEGAAREAIAELEDSFLVDGDRDQLVVHDLIGVAVRREASSEEVDDAHRAAASLCRRRIESGTGPLGLEVIDAVHHHLEAGEPDQAWDLVERWYSALATSGDDHLLLEPLARLRDALPARRVSVRLLIARCLLRASLIDEARRELEYIDRGELGSEGARYFGLTAEVAQRRGDMSAAEGLLGRALELARDDSARFHIHLQLSVIASLRGQGERARRLIDDAIADLTRPSSRQRGLAAWSRAISWMFEERYEFAADETRRGRETLGGEGLADLANRLAMIETLACIESDDMRGARAAASLIDEAGFRRPVAALYRSIARYADGDVRGASNVLRELYEYFRDHGDAINAYIAAYYASASFAAEGRLGDGQELMEQAATLAQKAGFEVLVARARAQQGLLAAESIQAAVAHRVADEALAYEWAGPRARATAHCAHAHAYTVEGDIVSALEHVSHAREAVSGPGLTSARVLVDVEHAGIVLVGGSLQQAVELAEPAVLHYRTRSRDYEAARAQLVLAAAYVARGRRADIVFAEEAVAAARELGDAGGLHSVQVGCAILSAALARHAHRDRLATELLTDALRSLGPERGTIYANALVAAIEGGVAAGAVPGAIALLGHLGLCENVGCYIVDQHGRRAATPKDVEREQATRDVFVDEVAEEITMGQGAHQVRGRPVMCSLLSQLIQARGEPVDPASLYKAVWNEVEYHPLQHRNRLYVAINRLRKSLRKWLGDREVVERSGGGWRIAAGTDASVAVPVRPAGE